MSRFQLSTFYLTIELFAWVLGAVCLLIVLFVPDKSRRKVFKLTWYVLAAIMTSGAIATPIIAFLYESSRLDFSSTVELFLGNEGVCYSFIACCYLFLFGLITKKMNTRVKCILGAVASVLFVAELFCINNLLKAARSWEWFKYNGYSLWDGFTYYVKEDLKYTRGLGLWRYAYAFLAQLALTAFVIFIKSKKGEKLKSLLLYKVIIPTYYTFHVCDLSKLMSLYEKGKIGPTAIFDYCGNMDYNERTMCDVLHCLNNGHDNAFLYDCLFCYFDDYLSRKQYLKYREKFTDDYDLDPIEACRELDEKFDVKYIGEYRENYFKDTEESTDEA